MRKAITPLFSLNHTFSVFCVIDDGRYYGADSEEQGDRKMLHAVIYTLAALNIPLCLITIILIAEDRKDRMEFTEIVDRFVDCIKDMEGYED